MTYLSGSCEVVLQMMDRVAGESGNYPELFGYALANELILREAFELEKFNSLFDEYLSWGGDDFSSEEGFEGLKSFFIHASYGLHVMYFALYMHTLQVEAFLSQCFSSGSFLDYPASLEDVEKDVENIISCYYPDRSRFDGLKNHLSRYLHQEICEIGKLFSHWSEREEFLEKFRKAVEALHEID